MNTSHFAPSSVLSSYAVRAAALTALAVLLKSPSLSGELVMDDRLLLLSEEQRGCGVNPVDCFRRPLFLLYYRPVVSASFALGVRLHGVSPLWHHLENLVLHGVVVALFFWVFRRLFASERMALVAGAVFALHPVQVTVTSFVGGRTDTLALAGLGGFCASVLRAHFSEGVLRRAWLAVAWLAFAFALFSKEQCLGLMFLAPVLLSRLPSFSKREALGFSVALFGAGALYLACMRRVLTQSLVFPLDWTLGLRFEIVGRTLWAFCKGFLGIAIAPLHQSSLGAWSPSQPHIAIAGYLLAVCGLFLVWRLRRAPWALFFAFWAFLSAAPCLNIVPAPSQLFAPYRLAIPLAGMAGLAAIGFEAIANSFGERVPQRVAMGLCLIYGVVSFRDAWIWRRETTVLKTMIAADPNFMPPVMWLADARRMRGDYRGAVAQFEAAFRALGVDRVSENDLQTWGRNPRVIRDVRSQSGLSYAPLLMANQAFRGSAYALYRLQRYAESVAMARKAVAAKPTDRASQELMSECLIRLGQDWEAMTLLSKLRSETPSATILAKLGYALLRLNRFQEAVPVLQEALAANPPLSISDRERVLGQIRFAKERLGERNAGA